MARSPRPVRSFACLALWTSCAALVACFAPLGISSARLRADDDAGADAAAAEDGFRALFDQKTLAGWDGDPRFWRVEDGAITGQTTDDNKTPGNTFLIWRRGELDDFELRLEYRIAGGNSGIQYRSFENETWGRWVVGGYQGDFEAGDRYSGICYGERFRGILADRGQSTVIDEDGKPRVQEVLGDAEELQRAIKKDDWNSYRITARGWTLEHQINGKTTARVVDEDTDTRRRSGILALQLHAGPPMKVQFRNIRLKRLPLGDQKKLVLFAGQRSHGYGAHEFNAGCLLMARLLAERVPGVHTTVYNNHHHLKPEHPVMDERGWPLDPTAFDNADAIVFFMNGGDAHPINRHLAEIDACAERGVGLAFLHYAVEVPKGASGERFLDWTGGYFEAHWSVNPHWTIENAKLAAGHPITRGVEPFSVHDEWYFHMRLRDGLEGVTPILSAVPPAETMARPDGPHSGNPTVRARVARGELEHLAWARQRPDGGRGFGFTGLHDHKNFQVDGFRTLLLNAMVWVSGAEVPAGGVPSARPSDDEIAANQDYERPK